MLAHKYKIDSYLMENEDELCRLLVKTDLEKTKKQALWAGIKPGMRVADIGCGPGITSYLLSRLTEPGGEVVGLDRSGDRIAYANQHYSGKNVKFTCRDVRDSLEDLGKFDFIWARFILEYLLSSSSSVVKALSEILNPGGIICLIDLDLNCLNHYEMPEALENSLKGVMKELEEKRDFDPYAGRKLYSYLYDLEYENICIDFSAHHLIYGPVNAVDEFNWVTKVMVAARQSGYNFYNDFSNGFEGFLQSFQAFFQSPRRFTYTPLIACTGTIPVLTL